MGPSVSFFQYQEGLKVWVERVLLGFFSLLFVFALYSLMVDRFWLQYVHEISWGLKPMAKIVYHNGDVLKRTRIDTLWLPVQLHNLVFDGDVISTFSESTVEISISPTSRLFVEPDSLVRLRSLDGKPLIRLSEGTVKAEFSEDQLILIKKGSEIKEILMRKGTYLIRNEQTAGIQITTFDQATKKVAGEKEESQTKAQASDETIESSRAHNPIDDLQGKAMSAPGIIYDLPIPADNTVFLLKSPKDIIIAAKSTCENFCELKIYKDTKLVQRIEFKKNQPSYFKIEAATVKEGYYEWSFETETSNYKSSFEIRNFSEEDLEKSIQTGRPVEIL